MSCELDIRERYKRLGFELGHLLAEKRDQYGDSYAGTKKFLNLLFPDGIPTEKYGDVLSLVRIWEKMSRIVNRDPKSDSENPYVDIAGIALLGVAEEEIRKEQEPYDHPV